MTIPQPPFFPADKSKPALTFGDPSRGGLVFTSASLGRAVVQAAEQLTANAAERAEHNRLDAIEHEQDYQSDLWWDEQIERWFGL